MFSLQNGRPIAKIIGGQLDKEIIYLKTGQKCCKKCDNKCLIKKKPCCGGCCICYEDDLKIGPEIYLSDGELEPIPNKESRTINYIAGPEGSGKSSYASKYIKNYQKMFSNREFFVFSRLNKDDVIDKLKPNRVMIDESLYTDPIDIISDLPSGGLILFDDIDTIKDKKIKQAISKLKDDILEVGRHNDIETLITSHLISGNDRNDNRQILNSAHNLTVFPRSGSSYQINYVLSKYFGLSKEQIEKLMKLQSRWCTVNKKYPPYVLHEKGCYLLN